MKNIMSSTFMAVALWSSPPSALLSSNNDISNNFLMNNEIVRTTLVADAKEMASGSGSRVNKDPESLLRLGLPIPKDKEIRKFQTDIEAIRQDIASKRKAAALDGV